jgi:hypothetical protein
VQIQPHRPGGYAITAVIKLASDQQKVNVQSQAQSQNNHLFHNGYISGVLYAIDGKPTGQNERANQPVNMKELLTSNDPVIDNELG